MDESPTVLGLNVNPSFLLLIGAFIGLFTTHVLIAHDDYFWLILIIGSIVFLGFGLYFNGRFKVVEKEKFK